MGKEEYNFLVNTIHDQALSFYSKKYFKGDLLDIGCGTKPYMSMLSPFVDKHIGLDHKDTPHNKNSIDIFGSAYDIPVKDNSFDSVLCSAVLEHLEEPSKAIQECNRVLKKDGIAIYSIPFIWHEHEAPRDFFRYSQFGIKHLFEKNGFKILELKPLSGFIVTFTQLFVYYLNGTFSRGILRQAKVFYPLFWALQKIALHLNKYDRSTQWTWMYMVVVQKK